MALERSLDRFLVICVRSTVGFFKLFTLVQAIVINIWLGSRLVIIFYSLHNKRSEIQTNSDWWYISKALWFHLYPVILVFSVHCFFFCNIWKLGLFKSQPDLGHKIWTSNRNFKQLCLKYWRQFNVSKWAVKQSSFLRCKTYLPCVKKQNRKAAIPFSRVESPTVQLKYSSC